MSAKEKALEIFSMFLNLGKGITSSHLAKESSLLYVQLMFSELKHYEKGGTIPELNNKYWDKVKKEIKAL